MKIKLSNLKNRILYYNLNFNMKDKSYCNKLMNSKNNKEIIL